MRRIAAVVAVVAAAFGGIRLYHYAFRPNGWRAYPMAVRADLWNLDAAQERYRLAHGRFAGSLDSLAAEGLTLSAGVTVQVTRGDSTAYSAEGRHRSMAPTFVCTVARPSDGAREAGSPQCRGMVDLLGRPRLAR